MNDDQVVPEIWSKGIEAHMMADIKAVQANGKMTEFILPNNEDVYSAWGDNALKIVSARTRRVYTHDLGGTVMAHGISPVFAINLGWHGALAGMIICGIIFYFMLAVKGASKIMTKKNEQEERESIEREAEHWREEHEKNKNKKGETK